MKTQFQGKRIILAAAVASTIAFGATPFAHAAPAGPVVAKVCNGTACAPIPPVVAAVVFVAPIVIGNVQAAGREYNFATQMIRATTGISVRDINEYGIWGGPCSIFRRPLGC